MKFFMLLTVFAAVFLFLGCGQTPPPKTATNIDAVKPALPTQSPTDQLAQGRKIYMDNCAACHKEDGTGGKIEIEGKSISPDDLTSAKIKAFDDKKITSYIYKGIEDEGMPAFKDKLSEAEIREVVRYVRADIQKMFPSVETKASPQR